MSIDKGKRKWQIVLVQKKLSDREESKMNRPNIVAKSLLLFCFSLILMAHSMGADAQTPQQIAKKAFESVVILVMEDANGQPMSLGSGFFVRTGIGGDAIAASNLHVINGASQGNAKLCGRKEKFGIKGTVGIDPDRDLVLLKLSPAPIGHGLRLVSPLEEAFLPVGDSDKVEVGEPVYAIGNPLGLEGTFSQGIVSGIRQVGKDKILQITAPISPGSSGGPVLNSRGEVIGVSVAFFQGGQNLNFAIPSNYLKALIAKKGVVKPLTGAKSSANQRSIFEDMGGRSTDGVVGANLTYDSLVQMGNYSFSLINKLRESVRNVYCLVAFYDVEGNPLDMEVVPYTGVIPAGLAKRVTGTVDQSVERLNAGPMLLPPPPPRSPRGKIEFRVLDFQIVD